MTYLEACNYLGREPTQQRPVSLVAGKSAWVPRICTAPGELWQGQARRLVNDAVYHLWSPPGQAVLNFLSKERGFTPDTIKAFSLGWLPRDQWADMSVWGLPEILKDDGKPKRLWLPKGLTIPLFGSGPERVRIRRPAGDPRYYILRGSSSRALSIGDRQPATVIVESELDALLLRQEAGDIVNLVALGNAQTRPDREAAALLQRSRVILVGLDADQAGAKEAWRWWKAHYPQAHRWPPIQGKDPGEMFKAGVNLKAWVQAGLLEYAMNARG
jgi:hypothetical protein